MKFEGGAAAGVAVGMMIAVPAVSCDGPRWMVAGRCTGECVAQATVSAI